MAQGHISLSNIYAYLFHRPLPLSKNISTSFF
jgi:hypothetical protein